MLGERIAARYGVGTDSVILSPAPLYHTAPLAYGMAAHRNGATLVIMDRFDPDATLRLIEAHRVTFMQMVQTKLVRLLALPDSVRKGPSLSSTTKHVTPATTRPVD